jgi:hypothetical protein
MRFTAAILLLGSMTGCLMMRSEQDQNGTFHLMGKDVERMAGYDAADPVDLDRAARCTYWRSRYREVVRYAEEYWLTPTVRRSPYLIRAVHARVAIHCRLAAAVPRMAS